MVLPPIPVNPSGAGRLWEPVPLDSGFPAPEKTAMHPHHTSFPEGEGPGLGSLGQASWPQGSSPPPLEPRLEPESFHTESLAADAGTFAIS